MCDDFSSDVFETQVWQKPGASVLVDEDEGLLVFESVGSVDDWAERTLGLELPVTVRIRSRLVSGGSNYKLPWFGFYLDDDEQADFSITFLTGESYGWHFTTWTGNAVNGPSQEGIWVTFKLELNSEGGVLHARFDEQEEYQVVASGSWEPSPTLARLRISQPWDSHCEVDYIHVY